MKDQADLFPVNFAKVRAADIMRKNPLLISPSTRAIDALNLCIKQKYSGVGITDPLTKKLIGNVSVSDLRVLVALYPFSPNLIQPLLLLIFYLYRVLLPLIFPLSGSQYRSS